MRCAMYLCVDVWVCGGDKEVYTFSIGIKPKGNVIAR